MADASELQERPARRGEWEWEERWAIFSAPPSGRVDSCRARREECSPGGDQGTSRGFLQFDKVLDPELVDIAT